ncbi:MULTISPECIES: NRAMP family divalent metal transporter [unclassified Clostridioides]|uniref:NRAMP family divalent metal transporter n=1 Tax=unclassified Clostridioides TaxID=2635829 RepID=UPI001D0F7D36|nr:divalent metal cation transporter [Clostridioides sp. ZZV14-6150]MCC0659613.1 divalent metal cation transporter [Clostridioides sp. ZZV14-6154]MCC0666876.1 divalent metal cation transporter [Clostridioides sp. ZZV14-6153]MCC0718472.1 divalent metal cation transporter [Clostridioides sp. ZZV14-6105]MCC0722993.1 divalent metal cation transporter [Clostridioides sp. ZZV14-6104]MCC0725821.1 divalent metal cation transporter [Clostridioides sp. ZZV14-6045]MCC0729337.1 divalent metal cation tran
MSTKNITDKEKGKKDVGALIGAAFIMATSAIGPGFLTQTAQFTQDFGPSFSFVVLITTILFIGAQVNVWRVIGVSGLRGQDIANKIVPGLGYFVAFLVGLGGLAFNIGNVGGAALGMNVMFNMNMTLGTILSGLIAIFVFMSKNSNSLVDKITKFLALGMIIIVGYVAISNHPPVGEAVYRMVKPENPKTLIFPIITLLGGSVGGYITFAGGHRLIDAGITGEENIKEITKSSLLGILVATMMRVLLFLAILAVVSKGLQLDPENPAASAFKFSAGAIGYKFFGLVLWSAAITSVIGAAYTSVSFLKTLNPFIAKNEKYFIIAFIAISTLIMAFIGKPATLLILAGALNGLILPITLGIMLIASKRKDIVGDYKHPTWLLIFGLIVVLISAYAGITSLSSLSTLFA